MGDLACPDSQEHRGDGVQEEEGTANEAELNGADA